MPDYRGIEIAPVDFGGGVTTDSLFCAKEQPLFDFYEASRDRYRRALDIGANVGVHTLLMRKAGWIVRAFEPDPEHFRMLRENYAANGMHGQPPAELNRMAVSDHEGAETFVRVRGNTTGSHLKGDKAPYGELEEFSVPVVDCRALFQWADFAKIDCEGHEARLLLTFTPETRCECMVEVGNAATAMAIYTHMNALGRGMWSQKTGWKKVEHFVSDMPSHHSEGALFIGEQPPFPP